RCSAASGVPPRHWTSTCPESAAAVVARAWARAAEVVAAGAAMHAAAARTAVKRGSRIGLQAGSGTCRSGSGLGYGERAVYVSANAQRGQKLHRDEGFMRRALIEAERAQEH